MNYKRIIDISLPVSKGMIVYPGDVEFAVDTYQGETSTGSRLVMGSHCGTHIDAPRHVFKDGVGVDKISLNKLIGPCRVLDMTGVSEGISVKDLEPYQIKSGQRILVKTSNSLKGFKEFHDDFIYLQGDAADYLADMGIILFGIDYLSIKQKDSDDHRAHNSLLDREIVIFEGLNLVEVEEGEYFFLGLPLKLVGLDGSPSRVVLLEE